MIDSIRNAETLTFLERAPRTELATLDIGSIADRYMKTIKIDQESAVRMARETRGYSFEFQVLGYYAWEAPNDLDANIEKSRQYGVITFNLPGFENFVEGRNVSG